ncbi:MAG: hypothetical protein IJP70_06555 [Bacteroidales bacterium]|nr:hypothetical protein [Bacteroidales bacterium]
MANYKWSFSRIGGITRVQVTSGEDIAHLAELDKKMWTVLSCPTQGLEIDEASLKYMDTNNDGAIHVDEVIEVSKWLTSVLKNKDLILEGTDTLQLSDLNQDNPDGKALYDAAVGILKNLNKTDAKEISLADSSSSLKAVLQAKLEAALAAIDKSAAIEAPFGDQTDAVEAAYNALDAKVKDYFMRGKLSQFSTESTASLDVQVAQIQAISAENLTAKMDEIASYPIARVDGKDTLDLKAAINPAWAAQFEVIRGILDPKAKELTEADWNEIGAKIKAFRDYQASITITEADIPLDEESKGVQLVDKLLHLTRDYYTLLKNYVTLQDFYSRKKAIFQAGTLLIDQRSCDLCVKVADAGAIAAQAPKSNMYLVTCACVSRVRNESYNIIAAMTLGDVDDIYVGKNCIFYDRQGNDFEARVTSIIDNPISIKQAMWSPYKKMGKMISDQIEKFAAEKDAAVMDEASKGINEKTEAVKSTAPETAKETGKSVSSFDIAKYAGIFAAIGMAVGMLASALVAIISGITKVFIGLAWWKSCLLILAVICGIIILISGPSMFLAWLKLRRRNLAPVLNANGWAVNAMAKINIPFGATLSQEAKYPKTVTKDPFADKMPLWKKCLIWLVIILAVAAVACYFLHKYDIVKIPFLS